MITSSVISKETIIYSTDRPISLSEGDSSIFTDVLTRADG